MTLNTLFANSRSSYSFDVIVDEVRALFDNGTVTPRQPLYTLANYIPEREWLEVEMELEENGYLLRDRIGEILATQKWDND